MTNTIRFESHKGVSVLHVDYSGLTEEEMIRTLNQAAEAGFNHADLRILADFSQTRHSKEFNQKIKRHGQNYSRHGKSPRIAVLGIDSTLKRVIMNSTMAVTRMRIVKLFDTEERALVWLTT